jgi:predicted regulator of Ras-like GTPase activity (Roadblock/LC7/MglB family)
MDGGVSVLSMGVRINSTPTVLVLGPDGAIVRRAVGLARKADVIAALGSAVPGSGQNGNEE